MLQQTEIYKMVKALKIWKNERRRTVKLKDLIISRIITSLKKKREQTTSSPNKNGNFYLKEGVMLWYHKTITWMIIKVTMTLNQTQRW